MAIHKLVFDTTDATTRAASSNVGAYIRSDDGTLITHTTDGSREAIDVYTELGQTEDAAHTSGDTGVMSLAVAAHTEGAIHSADGDYAPLQVDSSGRLRVVADLDTTNLAEKAEDSAHSSGDIGNYVLAVRQDTLATSTDADGDYGSFKTNAKGELYTIDTDGNALLTTIDADTSSIAVDTAAMVVDLAAIETELLDQGTTLDSILTDTNAMVVDLAAIETELLDQGTTLDSIDAEIKSFTHAEDVAHVSGDVGVMSLAVRNDTLAALAGTDGDYAPLQVNADGALYVEAVGGADDALANTAIATASNPLGVANTAEDVVASPLASRKYLFVYNEGNKTAYIGASGVTSGTGFPLPPGSILEMRAGASIDIEWVAEDTNQEIRTLELS